MKSLIKATFLNLIVLYLADLVLPGFNLDNYFKTLVTAAFVFTILDKIVKPLLKILLLPINLVTLGLFRWVVSVITLILLEALVTGISINPFFFSGFNYQLFSIAPFQVGLILSYIVTSITIRLISVSVRWLIKS